jgi:hypothetical protein
MARKPTRYLFAALTIVSLASLASPGCSPVMEATRPTPVDTSQFAAGESRVQVVEAIGAPTANVKNTDKSCDVYKLYTRGSGGVGKGVIAAGEGAADVVTLGLAEVLFTPLEAGTRNAKHTVTFCYDKDEKLVSFNDAPPE